MRLTNHDKEEIKNLENRYINCFKFRINNHEWRIELKDGEEVLEEYQKRVKEAYACFGITFYKDHKIWICKDMCIDQIMGTLKHELTHVYIWEMGFYNVDFNNEELLCDFVSSIHEFIEEVLERFKNEDIKRD